MTTKIDGTKGIVFPDTTEQASKGITQVDADARYVNLTGDTMAGNLTAPKLIAGLGHNVVLDAGGSGPAVSRIGFYSDNSGYSLEMRSGATGFENPVARFYDDGRLRLKPNPAGVPDIASPLYGMISYTLANVTSNLHSIVQNGGALNLGYYWEGGVGEGSVIQSVNTANLSADRSLGISCSTFSQNGNLVTTAAGNTSDRRTKENIEGLSGALDKVLRLRPVTFTFKQEYQFNRVGTQFGVIADEIEQVVPEIVHIDATYAGDLGRDEPDRIKSVDYISLVPILTAAIQELSAKLDAALTRVAELEAR